MYDAHEVAIEATPGLELILNCDQEKGRDIFANHYLPIVKNFVTGRKLSKSCRDGFSARDYASIILGNIAVKSPDFFRDKDLNTDKEMQKYLFWSVRNYVIDLTRKQKRRRRQVNVEGAAGEQIQCEAEERGELRNRRFLSPEQHAMLKQKLGFAIAAMKELPPEKALLLEMAAEGASHSEIAEELGVGLSSVGNRLRQAQRALLKKIYEQNPGLQGQLL